MGSWDRTGTSALGRRRFVAHAGLLSLGALVACSGPSLGRTTVGSSLPAPPPSAPPPRADAAPPEVFSFNEAVGPTTLATGFRVGYGITSNGDRPQTVPSVGGGICQVATTVFQAAFWAGLPFVERHYHLYWISRYGVAPSGRT